MYQRLRRLVTGLLTVVSFVLSACGSAIAGADSSAPPSPVRSQNASAAYSKEFASVIEPAIQSSEFASVYSGLYALDSRLIVLVTAQEQAVTTLLIGKGVPASAFEVRRAATSLQDLQRAEAAGERWLEQFPGGWGIGINPAKNRVLIGVEHEPLVQMIGYDPGTEPVPYDRWPQSLRDALDGIVPGVAVELHAGFSATIPELSSDPASIP